MAQILRFVRGSDSEESGADNTHARHLIYRAWRVHSRASGFKNNVAHRGFVPRTRCLSRFAHSGHALAACTPGAESGHTFGGTHSGDTQSGHAVGALIWGTRSGHALMPRTRGSLCRRGQARPQQPASPPQEAPVARTFVKIRATSRASPDSQRGLPAGSLRLETPNAECRTPRLATSPRHIISFAPSTARFREGTQRRARAREFAVIFPSPPLPSLVALCRFRHHRPV